MARSKTPGVVHIPWYATGFRGDAFAEALAEFAPIAMRYGALDYQVFRSREDRYRFLQIATFETKLDWERFWEGDEAVAFRVNHSGWYQVPVLPVWHDRLAAGSLADEAAEAEEATTASDAGSPAAA
ncbi:MAG: hypothetical protein IRZ32_03990 [Solirubrobacteraceae bacterium]|nr:hypothetical protein [Solirubrobacteraceae bacterium]